MEFTLLDVSFGLIFWSTITFLLLLIVLKKYLWGPLLENLDRRESTIHDAMKKAEEAQQKSEKTLEEYNSKLAEARDEVRKIIASGKESAERTKADIIEEANKRSASLVEKAKKEISAEKAEALNEIKKAVVDISILAAEKMIKKNLSADDQMKLIEDTMKSMAKEG